jgi:integrase/DNA-binding transcriptional regulator YhcF (GntR family)
MVRDMKLAVRCAMASEKLGKQRTRGSIDRLPSGGLRVRMYAGTDPVTGRDHYLNEVVPAGPRAGREAEKVRTRLLAQVDERRQPRTNATVEQLLSRHLSDADLEANTLSTYHGYVRKHVLPFIGQLKVGEVDADILDSLYAELRRCREHCSGQDGIDHRTTHEHECDDRCGPHACRPLGSSTIRQIHFILSGAFKRAVRWHWVALNPITHGEPPAAPKPNPEPPTSEEAARIVNEAWSDPDWGTFVWLAMVTGMRRGELCALRWKHVDMSTGVLSVKRSIAQRDGRVWEKDIKTHQQRRITLDNDTIQLLTEHNERCVARARAVDATVDSESFVFSRSPDNSTHLLPDSVTSRYSLLAQRLGIATSLHKLRHYSATELIAAGVDIRTVAGRLGHGSGGVTTLRVYAAWVSEADQRAAGNLASRMPPRPRQPSSPALDLSDFTAVHPFEEVAVSLAEAIQDGSLAAGLPIPPIKKLAQEYEVSVGTVQRAVGLIKQWGLVEEAPGRRNVVRRQGQPDGRSLSDAVALDSDDSLAVGPEPLDLEIRKIGEVVSTLRSVTDTADHNALARLLEGAVRRNGDAASEIDRYEMAVRRAGEPDSLMTFVTCATEAHWR